MDPKTPAPARTPRPARPVRQEGVISALVGGVLGGLLWLAWEPSTRGCTGIGECLGRPLAALILSALAVPVTLLVLWLLRVRPVFVTTVLGFAAGGALIVTLSTVANTRGGGTGSLTPWWTWVLIGALAASLSHWVNQLERRWVSRIVPILAVIGLVAGGLTWAEHERGAQRLARLQAVGVEQLVLPQVPGYHLSSAWPSERAEGSVEVIMLNYYADEGVAQAVTGLLIPLQERDPCELALAARSMTDRECVGGPEAMELRWRGVDGEVFYVGAGRVVGEALVVLTADPDTFGTTELQEAVDSATPSTLEELRDL